MNERKREWLRRDERVLWHGFTQATTLYDTEPLVVQFGSGRELIDLDGRHYLDAISSLWVITLGHRDADLDRAISEQSRLIAHSTMLGNTNRIVIRFAEELQAVLPVNDAHLLFASDGTSAVEQALKIAFQYWQNIGVSDRTQFLALGGAYHRDTVGALSVGDRGFGTGMFDPLRFPVLRTPGYADRNWLVQARAMVEAHHEQLAAAIIEPLVQAASGMLVSKPEEVNAFGRCCNENGVLLIADEVATGFGRTGELFASGSTGIRPDLMCLGKGITGGYLPMSATAASGAIYEALRGGAVRTLAHGHSYGGNALAAAVGLAHLEALEKRNVLENVRERAEQLHGLLDSTIACHKLVHAVRQVGLLVGVELISTKAASRRHLSLGQAVCAAAVRRGVLLRPLGNVIPIVPPLTITDQEVERIVNALVAALDEELNEQLTDSTS